MIAAIAMLHNTATDTFHPILYRDAPMPGDAGGRRLKSMGHHTGGFATHAEAKQHVLGDSRYKEAEVMDLESLLPWDGDGIPADVCFLDGGKLIRI